MYSFCIKSNNQNLLNDIYTSLRNLNIDNSVYKKNRFKLYHNIIIHIDEKNTNIFVKHFTNILTNCIIKYYESKLINRIINLDYFYFTNEDKKIIFDEYKLIKAKKIYDLKYVKKIIKPAIIEYLNSNKSLIISGFVNFRLSNYLKYLEKIVAESVNQYIVDKEYINFVNLLRNYINSKKTNNLKVNLINISSNGILLSDNGEIIKLDSFNSAYISDISFSQNDYILNTLVGLLPSKIKIHLVSPKDQFIKTIEMIFTNKVQYCEGCKLCKAFKLFH
ncbi:MAG: putative sporulation protein YtxC [Clostridia bacterium]|nr:putative sporulation protein YtxC [Clostridia bacterium]